VDFIHPREVTAELLEQYRVIVVPFPYVLGEELCALLDRWVAGGGTLIGEAYFAGWDVPGGRHQTTVPGFGLHKLFAARQGEVRPPDTQGQVMLTVSQDLAYVARGTALCGTLAGETLIPDGAEVLAVHANGDPAATIASYGKGRGILIGTYLGMPFHRQGTTANADFLASLVAMGTQKKPAVLADGSLVRIDLLSDASGGVMLIVRNLELRSVSSTAFIPQLRASSLVEQFSSASVAPTVVSEGGYLDLVLRPGEVQVYRG